MVVLSVFALFLLPNLVAQAQTTEESGYKVLAPLPGTTSGECKQPGDPGCKTDLQTYLPGLFRFAIGVSIAFVLLNLVFGGFQWMSSDAFTKKEEGKKRIENSLKGILLVAGAWLILNTINPSLLDTKLDIQPIDIPTQGGAGSSAFATGIQEKTKASCPTCSLSANSYNISSANIARLNCPTCIPITGLPKLSNNMNENVSADTKIKLDALKMNMGTTGWGITEGWPPVVNHQHDCHYNGTCVDAKLAGTPTKDNINKFFTSAKDSGLGAQYEVKTQERANELRLLGVTGTILVVPGINGEHFSVYNCSANPTKCN